MPTFKVSLPNEKVFLVEANKNSKRIVAEKAAIHLLKINNGKYSLNGKLYLEPNYLSQEIIKYVDNTWL